MIYISNTLKYLITTVLTVKLKNEKPWTDIQIPCKNWKHFDIDDFHNDIVNNQQLLIENIIMNLKYYKCIQAIH